MAVAVVRLLGEVGVEVGGRPVDLGTPKQRCVLAALAVDAGRVVPLDRLLERVWGVDAAPRSRASLHNYISRLRRALAGADGLDIAHRSGGYALVADTTEPVVDLHRFRDLRTAADAAADEHAARLLTDALGLWHGQPLTGVDGEWVEAERDRLAQEQLAAQHDLTDTRLRLGHGSDLAVELAARAEAHPLDERVAGQYVLALHQAGRTADALEHYQQLRKRLAEELGTDPGAALQDLHQRVLDLDHPSSPAMTWTDRPVVPAQLPAPPGLFTGRATQLTELDHALITPDGSPPRGGQRPGATAVISAIGGTGGIGKTWLALTWAHRNLHRFPDGQLSVDLRGFSPGEPKQPTDVLADFLAALGVDRDHQPSDPDARAALYRSHTAGKRMLILLDNAATTDQVVPLLPGDSCTVLVTSRNRLPALLTRHGAHPVQIDVLTDTEARTVLTTALGQPPTPAAHRAVTELITLCGGFPLALGLVAARIRTHPHLLDDIVTDLRELRLDALDSDDPDASLPAVLSWSLRHLTEEQRTVFALLGTAPGPDTTTPAVAVLTDLPPIRARKALSALEEASLVERRPHRRYVMHDLVRDYATTTPLPDGAREAALVRVMDFHLHTAHTAAHLLNPYSPLPRLDPSSSGVHPLSLPDGAAAMAWLAAEHATLLATQRTAVALGHHHVVWHLAWALEAFHVRQGHRREALTSWRAALDAAAHLSDLPTNSRTRRFLGRAHSLAGLHEEAVEHLERALDLAVHHRDTTEQARTHHELAFAWDRRQNDRKALEHARQSLALHRTLDNPVRVAIALNQVGWFAARLGELETAREHCRAALALYEDHHNPDGRATTLDSLGFIAHRAGDHRRAVDHYHQALTLFRARGHTSPVADTLDSLGHPHVALGQHAQARAAWREALALYRKQGRDTDAERVQRQLDDLDRDQSPPGTETAELVVAGHRRAAPSADG